MRWWLQFGRYVRPHMASLATVLLLLLAGVGLTALAPWPLKLIIDHVLVDKAVPPGADWLMALPGSASAGGLLAWLALGTVVIFAANSAAAALRSYVEVGLGDRIAYALGEDLLDSFQRQSPRFHARFATGDMVRRVTVDSTCVRDLLMGVAMPLVTSVASLGLMSAVLWQLDHTLTLIGMLAAVPLALAIRLSSSRMARRTYEHLRLEGQIMSLAEQTLGALPAVKAFDREAQEDRRFRGLSAEAIRAYLRATVSQLEFRVSVGAATAVMTALIMGLGGFRVLEGSLSTGSLLVFLAYLTSLYAPMETLALLSENYAGAAARAQRIREILDAVPEVSDPPGAKPFAPRRGECHGYLRLDGVTFGYEPGRPTLRDVSLDVRPGETVAIVGHSGAGKSTLVSLIARVFDPWEGEITLDGRSLRDLRRSDLRRQIALVLQEPFLLPLTVAQNIAYGRPGASHDEIIAAAVAASADGFVRNLPRGYDTIIGERGATLSGGERQRLAIARAILKDAPIIILDEPTSALDVETEASVLEALRRLVRDRTAIIIAHRLSTVRDAGRIVVLEAGRIVEVGSHEDLLARRGLYYRLYYRSVPKCEATR